MVKQWSILTTFFTLDEKERSIQTVFLSNNYAKEGENIVDGCRAMAMQWSGHLPLDYFFSAANLVKLDMTKIVDGRHDFDLGLRTGAGAYYLQIG